MEPEGSQHATICNNIALIWNYTSSSSPSHRRRRRRRRPHRGKPETRRSQVVGSRGQREMGEEEEWEDHKEWEEEDYKGEVKGGEGQPGPNAAAARAPVCACVGGDDDGRQTATTTPTTSSSPGSRRRRRRRPRRRRRRRLRPASHTPCCGSARRPQSRVFLFGVASILFSLTSGCRTSPGHQEPTGSVAW